MMMMIMFFIIECILIGQTSCQKERIKPLMDHIQDIFQASILNAAPKVRRNIM